MSHHTKSSTEAPTKESNPPGAVLEEIKPLKNTVVATESKTTTEHIPNFEIQDDSLAEIIVASQESA